MSVKSKKNLFFWGFSICLLLSALTLSLSFFLPNFISTNYYQKSLRHLRQQAKAIKTEFGSLINQAKQKQKSLLASPFPQRKEEIFALFKKQDLNKTVEGVAYYDQHLNLILWLGNVIDLKPIFQAAKKNPLEFINSSLLVQDKASSYLIFFQRINSHDYLGYYRLLAFVPHLQSPYLREYQFLKPKLAKNCQLEYRDFREDISGYEKLFARHQDEYIGQPQLQDKVQTIFFPLRNEKNKIVATITLRSPALAAKISTLKENIFLAFYLLAGISLVFLLFYILKRASSKSSQAWSSLATILILMGLRFIFLPISNLEKIKFLPFFSPAKAGFISIVGLTKSPADIFLTSLFLFFLILSLRPAARKIAEKPREKVALPLSLIINLGSMAAAIFFIFNFQTLLFRLVFNSNLNLLRFSFNFSFLMLHLSLFLFFLSFSLAIFSFLKIASIFSPSFWLPLIILILEFGAYFLVTEIINFPFLFSLEACLILIIFLIAFFPIWLKKRLVLFATFILSALFIYSSLQIATSFQSKRLIQTSLYNIIKSEEDWGKFLIRQSIPQIEKRKDLILSLFHKQQPAETAHFLWQNTTLAKFNWYSSLEIQAADGSLLSRFSLNIPILYHLDYELPLNRKWASLRRNMILMGKEKDFLIAYKDWFEGQNHLGRTIIYLSIDYEMLPFLYSANPYFDLLRVSSIPSLNQYPLGFAIYDLQGEMLFNPHKINYGLSSFLLKKIVSSSQPFWSYFQDKRDKYDCFYVKKDNRIYSLFLPQKDLYDYAVEFLKLFFLYLVFSFSLFILFLITSKERKIQNPFWSFANRVYISFFAVALIPLILFTFFTRNFFSRIFSQQFTEKAAIHATLAQGIIEDLVFLQQQEQLSPTIPPENDVLWISATIDNDVNLYQNGKLVSSSRREFFDSGLFPELIDGEIYFRIQYENNPYYTQTQKIGDYSFHTLTVPLLFGHKYLLISLPFPLEQQEISAATLQLIEFLFFISVFFGFIVLFFARGIGAMIIKPIQKLLAGTKEISLGNLEISIEHKSKDEMKTLIDGFNTMVKNLKKHQQELAEMSKKAAWAEMAHKVAHEIKNPLTPIRLSAEHLLRVYEDRPQDFKPILKESVSYIIKEVENLRKIAREFLEISKETSLHKQLVDVREIIEGTIEPYQKTLIDRIKIKASFQGKDFPLWADEAKLKIALRNIITNAIEAIKDRGEIEIKVSKEKKGLRMVIKDTGLGIKKNLLDKIFEPYFSTKEVGTGLGLPIAKKIIESHGGSLRLSSQEGKGTKIIIHLPQESLEVNREESGPKPD